MFKVCSLGVGACGFGGLGSESLMHGLGLRLGHVETSLQANGTKDTHRLLPSSFKVEPNTQCLATWWAGMQTQFLCLHGKMSMNTCKLHWNIDQVFCRVAVTGWRQC